MLIHVPPYIRVDFSTTKTDSPFEANAFAKVLPPFPKLPSKSLIFNGERGIDFTEAVARKEKLTGMLRAKNYHMISDEATGTVMDGTARFLSNHQIEVTNNGHYSSLRFDG